MLAEYHKQLLSAFVDGELTPRQRRAVERLLESSPEARILLEQLQQDHARLQRLPRRQMDRDFAEGVVGVIVARNLRPGRGKRERPWVLTMPVWRATAVAASVLVVVTAASYFLFARLPQATSPETGEGVAQVRPEPDRVSVRPDPGVPATVPSPAPEPEPRVESPARASAPPMPEPVQTAQPSKEPSPAPAQPADAALAAPVRGMEMFQPRSVDPALPIIFRFADLNATKLNEELRKASGFRLELPVNESSRAFDSVQSALKANGITPLIEQAAQARLKQPSLKTNLVVYSEEFTPEELARVILRFGVEDRKMSTKKKVPAQLDGLVLTRMTPDDHKELAELVGVDLQANSSRSAGPLGVDPRKPLAEQTAEQVSQALKGQGGVPRPEPGKPVVKPTDRVALVLPYNPVRPRSGSPEVKRFIESRKSSRSGTIQVLLVLREVSN